MENDVIQQALDGLVGRTVGDRISELAAEFGSTIGVFILESALQKIVGCKGPVEIGGRLAHEHEKYQEMDQAEREQLKQILSRITD